MKMHMSLPVHDLAATQGFYAALFDQEPTKVKADYVKFDVARPALNISFVPGTGPIDTDRHLGVQFSSQDELDGAFERLTQAGLVRGGRDESICCYANQDKFWVRDPTGYAWELYYLLDDTEIKIAKTKCCGAEDDAKAETRAACC